MATGFINATGVTAGNNTSVISVTLAANGKSVDFSHVVSGTAIYIDGVLYEGISGTAPTPQGDSTVTVKENITPAITNGALKGFNTIEGLRDAIRNARDIADNLIELDDIWHKLLTGTTETIEFELNGQTHVETPYQYLVDQFAAGDIEVLNATNAERIDVVNKSTNDHFDIVLAGSDSTSNTELVRDSASNITGNPNTGLVKANYFHGLGGRTAVSTLSVGTAGNNNGYFTFDEPNKRTTFTGGQFYLTNSVTHFINYAPIQYHGDTGVQGQSLFRANTLSGDAWTLTAAGTMTAPKFVGDLEGNADSATTILTASSSADWTTEYDIMFANTSTNAKLYRVAGSKLKVTPSTGRVRAAGGFEGDLTGQATTALGVYCPVSASDSWYDLLANNDTAAVNTTSAARRSGGNKLTMQPSTGIIKSEGGYHGKVHVYNHDQATAAAGSEDIYPLVWSDDRGAVAGYGNLYRSAYELTYNAKSSILKVGDGSKGTVDANLTGIADESKELLTKTSGASTWHDMLATTSVGTAQDEYKEVHRAATSNLTMQYSSGSIKTGGSYGRKDINDGYLTSHNSVAGSTNPIFCANTPPAATTLDDMYGIGYARGDSAFVTNYGPSTGGWGMYVASGGAARIFLDSTFGNISITGTLYGNASKVQVGNNTSATGAYPILWGLNNSGVTGESEVRSSVTQLNYSATGTGTLTNNGKTVTATLTVTGQATTSSLDVDGLITPQGTTADTSTRRSRGLYGNTDVTKVQNIWSEDTGYYVASNGLDTGNMRGLFEWDAGSYAGTIAGSSYLTWKNSQKYMHAIAANTTSSLVWAKDGTPQVIIGESIWTQGDLLVEGVIIAENMLVDKGHLNGAYNLNTFTTTGQYTLQSESHLATTANFPKPTQTENVRGVLFVESCGNSGSKGLYIYQTYRESRPNTNQGSIANTYHRQSDDSGTTWSPWLVVTQTAVT